MGLRKRTKDFGSFILNESRWNKEGGTKRDRVRKIRSAGLKERQSDKDGAPDRKKDNQTKVEHQNQDREVRRTLREVRSRNDLESSQ